MYLFHGSDTTKTRSKAFDWVRAARAKAPDAAYVRISADALTRESLSHALGAQGLFFARTLVLLDDPFSESAAGELVMEMAKELASSQNPVAVLAPKLLAARVKKLEPLAEKVFESTAAEKKPTRGFNSSLVNALGAKDAAVLWKEIVKAHRQGDAPEMVHGLLHWKARDLMQKANTKTNGAKWTKDEARQLSRSLIELVSESRSGESLDLQLALERFALSL